MLEGKKVLVFGGSGAVGTGILGALAQSPKYSFVTLILRRVIDLPQSTSTHNYGKFKQELINFDRVEDFAHLFKNGYHAVFYAVGVSSIKVSEQEHHDVELKMSLHIMELLHAANIPQVHMMSSMFTSKTSWIHHLRVKAEVEEKLGGVGFQRFVFYRTGGVLTPDYRGMLHPIQQFFAWLTDPFRWGNIPAEIIGEAMVNNSFSYSVENEGAKSVVEILEHSDIKRLAANSTTN